MSLGICNVDNNILVATYITTIELIFTYLRRNHLYIIRTGHISADFYYHLKQYYDDLVIRAYKISKKDGGANTKALSNLLDVADRMISECYTIALSS